MTAIKAQIFPRGVSDQIGWGLLLSFGAHTVLILAMILWPGLGPSKREIFAPVYKVRLVGPPARPAPAPAPAPAVKPAPKPKPQPLVKPEPAPTPAPKPKEAIGNKETVKKTKRIKREKPKPATPDASKMLEKKIKRLKRKVTQERRLDSAIGRLESKVAARGRSGGGSRADNKMSMRFQIYYTQLWERIRRHWVLPEALVQSPAGLVAVVVMRIKRDGSLEKTWLEQSSGNRRFDASAMRAAERAAPYPPLPSGLRESVHEVGVRFRPEDI